jgi:hypothetical protein
MNALTAASIGLLILGSIIFIIGMIVHWNTNPISGWADASITVGMLFLLGAIAMLCVSYSY